jgi:hypothetical protein
LEFDSLRELFYELDEEEYDEPVKFIIYEQTEGGNNNYFSIEILDFEKELSSIVKTSQKI